MKARALLLMAMLAACGGRAADDGKPAPTTPAPTTPTPLAPTASDASAARSTTGPCDAACVDALVQPLFEYKTVRGLAIAIVQGGDTAFHMRGARGEVGTPAPSPDTEFEVASVSKVFTALLLADLVVSGKVELDDAIGIAGSRITYEQLATHTSGLPRIPPLPNLTLDDPYATYTVTQLETYIAKLGAEGLRPGTFEYSNLGFGLLGHAIQRAARNSLDALLVQRVARPLGMARTRIGVVDRPGTPGDAAIGHGWSGKPAQVWTPGSLSGAYAVHSTARDLATFLRANIEAHAAGEPGAGGPARSVLTRAMALAHRPRTAVGHGHAGLGWLIADDRGGVIWHNGRSGGFSSFVAFHPGKKVGVVVLANTSTEAIDSIGFKLIARVLSP